MTEPRPLSGRESSTVTHGLTLSQSEAEVHVFFYVKQDEHFLHCCPPPGGEVYDHVTVSTQEQLLHTLSEEFMQHSHIHEDSPHQIQLLL